MNMRLYKYLFEAAYKGNVGALEMISFYKTASNSEITQMEKIVDKADWNAFKKLIKKVTKTELK